MSKLRCVFSFPAVLFLLCSASYARADDGVSVQEDTGWMRIQLDSRFRSEGVAAADFNDDGRMDVAAGDILYIAPEAKDLMTPAAWTMHEVRSPGEFVAGRGYSNSFANFAWDMDRDGLKDLVIVGFPGDPFHWYHNPGAAGLGSHWKQGTVWSSACNESPEFEDLNGDGVPEFIVGSQPEAQMGYVTIPQDGPLPESLGFTAISEKGDPRANGTFKYYHGLGAGDVNGDGRRDVIICHGWWEAPESPSESAWKFHPIRITTDNGLQPLPAAANIYTDDLDLDGDSDLILSSAHQHGIWWVEQRTDENGETAWVPHVIDTRFSQTHAMEMADINGDGQLDFVTGKRYFAHNGGDPGGHDAVVMYWYEVKRTKGMMPEFTAHEIVAGRNTGIGTQFDLADINGDGRTDVVLSNKMGVNVLVQVTPVVKKK